MATRIEKMIELLREYSIENGTIIRSTSDLSQLELWLIGKNIELKEMCDGDTQTDTESG